eukprot:6181469-Pleurochrysis_carterae.AAC.2
MKGEVANARRPGPRAETRRRPCCTSRRVVCKLPALRHNCGSAPAIQTEVWAVLAECGRFGQYSERRSLDGVGKTVPADYVTSGNVACIQDTRIV